MPAAPSLQIPTVVQYAVTRVLDPNTGDYVMNGVLHAHGYPMLETVIRVVRTVLGTIPQAPDFGVDQSRIDVARANAGADFRAAIIASLSFYTKRSMITRLAVDTEQTGSSLIADVSFYDPRAKQTFSGAASGLRFALGGF